MENKLVQFLSQYIDQNSEIDEINVNQALKMYSKQDYILDGDFIVFLKQVCDKKIKYCIDNEVSYIDFRLRKVLKDCPKLVIKRYETKFDVIDLVPFAEIYNGHMILVKSKENHIYGIYDDVILLFGKTLIDGLKNVLKNRGINK